MKGFCVFLLLLVVFLVVEGHGYRGSPFGRGRPPFGHFRPGRRPGRFSSSDSSDFFGSGGRRDRGSRTSFSTLRNLCVGTVNSDMQAFIQACITPDMGTASVNRINEILADRTQFCQNGVVTNTRFEFEHGGRRRDGTCEDTRAFLNCAEGLPQPTTTSTTTSTTTVASGNNGNGNNGNGNNGNGNGNGKK